MFCTDRMSQINVGGNVKRFCSLTEESLLFLEPQATLNTLGDLVLLEVGFVHTRHQELDRFIFSLIRHTVHTVALSRITVHISHFHCIADLEIGHI